MAVPKIVAPINDFSAGEVDVQVKRSDLNIVKVGARQMSNWRILNSHKKVNRPGRTILSQQVGTTFSRIEEFSMKGKAFAIGFAPARIGIINDMGILVFVATTLGDGVTAIPWATPNDIASITYAIIGLNIYVTYAAGAPHNVPQILTWDGVSDTSTWTLTTYAETIAAGGQKRTAFYRIAPQNIQMLPSATTGIVNITFSQNFLTAGMVGTRIRYCSRQLQIKTVSSPTAGTATVIEPLPPAQVLTLTAPTGSFNTGDIVNGSISGAEGIVTNSPTVQMLFGILAGPPSYNVGDSVTGGTSGATGTITQVAFSGYPFPFVLVQLSTTTFFTNGETVTDTNTSATFTANTGSGTATTMTVQLLPSPSGTINAFTTSDTVVGPSGNSKISSVANASPQAVSVWDQEVMNTFNGYPSSVFADQARLGFCNIPVLPPGIIWSAVSLPLDLYTGAQPDDSIFELAPDQSQVFYVLAGMESSEFIFTDRAIYYLPINASNPLKPGSVAFNKLSDYGSQPMLQPRRAEQTIVYMKAGGTQVGAVQAPGAYYRPYVVDNISEMHSHLFLAAAATSIAIPSGPSQFEELYIYIALANGSLAVGHYAMRNGLLEPGPEGKPSVGWVPWSGVGSVNWVSSLGNLVLITANYPSGVGSVNLLEFVDANQYLDAAVPVNNPPLGLQAGQPAHSSLVGNMVGAGGLAASFNGTRVQASSASSTIAAADGYVGEQFATPQTIGQALVWPTSDQGFATGGTGNITLELRAKQTAPVNSSDGILLGSVTLAANQTTGPIVIVPVQYQLQTYVYAWIHISRSGATGLGIAQVLLQSGALWWLANGTVYLIDQGTRFMGSYNVDANGNIVPQYIGSENLASSQLTAGQPWTATYEPHMPTVPGGADQQQRMRRRKIGKVLVTVQNSSGFLLQKLVENNNLTTRRVPYYFVGDDATQPAMLREDSYQMRPRGRSYDPRFALVKDTPGPLTVVEYGFEVSV